MKKALLLALMLCMMANTVMAISYPVDMRISDDYRTLKKVYEFAIGSPDENIPRESFKLNGYKYSFLDFLVEPIETEGTFWAIEPIEFYSKTADINSILARLDKTKDVAYDNGFSGTIPLNLTSIHVSSMGTGTSSNNLTQTRTYPNLSSADMSYIPKTLDYNGQALTLTNVQWQSDNTQTINHQAITDRYSCVATYGGTVTSSYSKGYKVTADYQGELTKKVVEKVRWTAMFSGKKQFNYYWLLAIIPILGITLLIFKKRRTF